MKVPEGVRWRLALAEEKIVNWMARRSRASNWGARFRRYARVMDPGGEGARSIHNPHLGQLLALLKRAQFEPRHIVDIGANRGNWTREVRKSFPDASFTLFEPQPKLREAMADLLVDGSRVELNTMGVGRESGEMMFTLHERDDSSSFAWTPERAKERGFKQISVPVTTLDAYLAQRQKPWPDIIKIDAEGWDLEVLEGAAEALSHAGVVLIEAAVGNQSFPNTLLKVCTAMDRLDYRLLDLTDLNRTPGGKVLWLVELAFVKKGSALDGFAGRYG